MDRDGHLTVSVIRLTKKDTGFSEKMPKMLISIFDRQVNLLQTNSHNSSIQIIH